MTTTDLYSGYDRDGKPTSRVLRPPGGGSSNIFGNEPDPQQQLRQQEQTPVLDRNQNQSEPAARQPFQQQEDTRSANKARKPDGAPYAENDNGNPYETHGSSQNDRDFRCHSVTAYREAITRNAEVRGRAHGGKASSFNVITHEDTKDEQAHYQNPNQYSQPSPQQAHGPSPDRGKRQISQGATTSFNPITHEEYNGEGYLPQYNQHAAPPPQPQANVMPEQTYGRRDTATKAYNPITGEEYPDDYGKKRSQAVKSEEEEDKNEETKEEKSTPTATATPGKNVRTSSRVLQPPGGATTQLW